ncbi:UNVERIFIED_ORG: hypothetical protein J2W19_003144 [Shinella zoogloeoides]|nr:hypothetical protein [Shinella zoogloeoides]
MALPKDVQALLNELEPQIRDAFLEAIDRITSQAQLSTIVGHLQAGNVEAAITALRMEPVFFQPLDRAIMEAYYRGGVLALASLPRIPDPFLVGRRFSALMDATFAPKPGDENMSQD